MKKNKYDVYSVGCAFTCNLSNRLAFLVEDPFFLEFDLLYDLNFPLHSWHIIRHCLNDLLRETYNEKLLQ